MLSLIKISLAYQVIGTELFAQSIFKQNKRRPFQRPPFVSRYLIIS